ncbi:MAG: UDP-N-acetylmuramoyl-tripeptide--D-alanyl-D-alanine ligase [Syntrophaceae bacterium]
MESELTHPAFSGNDIVNATGGTVITGRRDKTFHGISTDSRHISPGNLFIPIKGEKFDGHNFITDAVRDGAAGFLIQDGSEKTVCQTYKNITIIRVPDTLTALGDIAHFWRNKCNASIIAITGSSGKTTTKEMVAVIAGLKKNVIKSQGNFNNLIGLPLTIFRIDDRHETAILELGTNRRGEIGRLTDIAAPDIGLITNIGPAHMEGLQSLDIIREEKCDLFRNMGKTGVAIINLDDEKLLITDKEWEGNTVTFGFRKDADVSADNIINRGIEGVRFTIKIGEFEKDITMSTVGNHNISNALAAAASSWALGIDFPTICQGLMAFQPISGRMEIHCMGNGAFIIDDTYNANPASFREALKIVKDLKGNHSSTVIMGDMLELGDTAEKMHEGIGSLMADTGVGTIFLRGRLSQATAAGAMKRKMSQDQIIFFVNPDEILPLIASHVKKGDFVLVKGSRRTKMEEIIQIIIHMFNSVQNPAKE